MEKSAVMPRAVSTLTIVLMVRFRPLSIFEICEGRTPTRSPSSRCVSFWLFRASLMASPMRAASRSPSKRSRLGAPLLPIYLSVVSSSVCHSLPVFSISLALSFKVFFPYIRGFPDLLLGRFGCLFDKSVGRKCQRAVLCIPECEDSTTHSAIKSAQFPYLCSLYLL